MRNSAVGVGCNIVFSLLFVRWLGLAGIALGTTFSAAALLWSAHRHLPAVRLRYLFLEMGRQLLAGTVLIGTLVLFRRFVPVSEPAVRFAADTAMGFVIYLLALALLGSREWKTLSKLMRSKIRRS